MKQEYKDTFAGYLSTFQKSEAVAYALKLVESQAVSIPELYESIITPALNSILVCEENKADAVWQEHLMTNIARTVVEGCYPFVLRSIKNTAAPRKSVAILCPEEEYHDIGPRMAADWFSLENFEVFYVGANTPLDNVLSICHTLKPDVLAFSVSNFYHISLLKDMISTVKQLQNPPYIIASGSALLRTNLTAESIGCDSILHSYSQIQQLKEALNP